MYVLFDPEGELPEQLHKFSAKVESIEAGNKPPHGAASVGSRPRGDVPSFVSSSQFHDLQDHGHEMTGGFESFLSAQDGATMAMLRESLITADGPRVPVEATDDLPARTAHLGPEALEKAKGLRKQFEELKKHGMRVGTLEDFLQAHGVGK